MITIKTDHLSLFYSFNRNFIEMLHVATKKIQSIFVLINHVIYTVALIYTITNAYTYSYASYSL